MVEGVGRGVWVVDGLQKVEGDRDIRVSKYVNLSITKESVFSTASILSFTALSLNSTTRLIVLISECID